MKSPMTDTEYEVIGEQLPTLMKDIERYAYRSATAKDAASKLYWDAFLDGVAYTLYVTHTTSTPYCLVQKARDVVEERIKNGEQKAS